MSRIGIERSFEKELERNFDSFRVTVEVKFKLDGREESVDLQGRGKLVGIYSRDKEVEFYVSELTSTQLAREPKKSILGFIGNQKGVREKRVEVTDEYLIFDYDDYLKQFSNSKKRYWINDLEFSIRDSCMRYVNQYINQNPINMFCLYDDESEKDVKVKFKVISVII